MKRQNKTGVMAIIVLITVAIVASIFMYSQKNSIEDAIRGISQYDVNLLYNCQYEGDNIIIYQHVGQDDLSFAVIEKSFFKYKGAPLGTIGQISESKNKTNISYAYIPKSNSTSHSYYYGTVNNGDIAQIKVFDNQNNYVHAHIIDTTVGKIWIAQIDGLNYETGSRIKCFYSNDEVIEIIEDHF